ncbi:WbqC family protein [Aegicerativicinus sediminis]|uniref:WbqC family protein n=1 Tax=Aegicerativicinus sediminis TaxID=2893202 RepID=UPI001E477BFA|nr:WbqC family protein [Aegicerativicinus sediminis]
MKVALMQPYFFPYLGYFQLIHAVDVFVVYDDVNFKKQSWITRNNILVNGRALRINLVVEGASSFKKIYEINRNVDGIKWLKTIEQSYTKAPYFGYVYPLIENIATNTEKSLSKFLLFSLQLLTDYLDIKTIFKLSSEVEKDINLKGEDKVIAICKSLNATNYINAIGGQNLYNKDAFTKNDIDLNFIKTNPISYNQFGNSFVPGLSIIDVLMFNSKETVIGLLNDYKLI